MTAANNIADKLDEARALIEKGWCQGQNERDGCYCIYGATYAVEEYSPKAWRLLRYVETAIGDELISEWNDAPERTQAEVIEAFRKAAELARQAQSA